MARLTSLKMSNSQKCNLHQVCVVFSSLLAIRDKIRFGKMENKHSQEDTTEWATQPVSTFGSRWILNPFFYCQAEHRGRFHRYACPHGVPICLVSMVVHLRMLPLYYKLSTQGTTWELLSTISKGYCMTSAKDPQSNTVGKVCETDIPDH